MSMLGTKFLGALGNLSSELGLTALASQSPASVAITGGSLTGVSVSATSLSVSTAVTLSAGGTSTGAFATTGAGGAFAIYDRNANGSSGQIYRSAGVNYLWDSTVGNVAGWDNNGVFNIYGGLKATAYASTFAAVTVGGTLTATGAATVGTTLRVGATTDTSGATIVAAAASYPKLTWTSTGNAANLKSFQSYVTPSGVWSLDAVNDAGNATYPVMYATSSGAGITSINLGANTTVSQGDARIFVKNINGITGAFIGDTYDVFQLGRYNPTGTASGGIAANSYPASLGISNAGKVGTLTNGFGSPVWRNILDDGVGNAAIAGYFTASSGSTFSGLATFSGNAAFSNASTYINATAGYNASAGISTPGMNVSGSIYVGGGFTVQNALYLTGNQIYTATGTLYAQYSGGDVNLCNAGGTVTAVHNMVVGGALTTTGSIVSNGNITSASTLYLTNGNIKGGNSYGTYGALTIGGQKNGYSGVNFNSGDGATNLGTLMVSTDAAYVGFYKTDSSWSWRFVNGVMDIGTIPAASVNAGTFTGAFTFASPIALGNGVSVGYLASSGWYHDGSKLAIRPPTSGGTTYFQGPAGAGTSNIYVSGTTTLVGALTLSNELYMTGNTLHTAGVINTGWFYGGQQGGYGTIGVLGTQNGWGGIAFNDNAGYESGHFMVSPGTNSPTTGFHNSTNGWMWQWNGADLVAGNIPEARITAPTQSLAASGYRKLPGGLIIQWATVSSRCTWTFPIAFPSACVSVTATINGTNGTAAFASVAGNVTTTTALITSTYAYAGGVGTPSETVYVYAVGY